MEGTQQTTLIKAGITVIDGAKPKPPSDIKTKKYTPKFPETFKGMYIWKVYSKKQTFRNIEICFIV